MYKYLTLALLFFTHFSYTQCAGFSQSISGTNPLCFGLADGSVSVMITGGTPPYDIEIRDISGELLNAGGEPETGFLLEDGWYYSHITDNEGCELYDSIRLEDPIPLSIESSTIMEPSGLDECDGTITIGEVLGDGDVLTYTWSPDPEEISGIDANIFTNACVLTYSLSVINENGCTTSIEVEVGANLSINAEKYESIRVYSQINESVLVLMPFYQSKATITFYDITGKVLANHQITSKQTNIQKPKAGSVVYSILIDGEVVKTGNL